jgi:hypothetical protein
MNKLISSATTKIISFFKNLRAEPLAAIILASWLLIATDVNAAQNMQPSGQEMLQRIRQHDQDSARPKTTGEFLEEARGDVPLNKRISNITKDSKEAFEDLGENISQGAKENLRGIKHSAAQTGDNLSKGIDRQVKGTLN